MAQVRDIQRTAAFAWSPDTAPFIATGTQAGAVAADFSDNTQLELWDLGLQNGSAQTGELAPVASVNTDSKFYDIAWGRLTPERPRGIIAGALENGSLDLWSVDALLSNSSDALISQTTKHTGSIKSLQFNPFRSELLATAGAKGELYVWDLNNTDNPFMLGNRVARADDFDCLAWNNKVPHILVTGGSGGFLTVWDVKAKKESLTLNNLGRKAVSAVAWHPEQQTKLITAVPDDTNPVILLWDLRNSNAPERTLTGHQAGVLSLSWCKQDVDLLLSCGKDNRTICWNPTSGEMLGEFPVVTNWTFKTSFNPRNPTFTATASFDGKIVVRTLQNTNPDSSQADTSAPADGDDFFSRASNAQTSSFSLKQPPKWLRRPVGATFGFGGKLVSVTTPPATAGQPIRSKVNITTFAVDSGVNAATENFEKALKEGNLTAVCEERMNETSSEIEKADWKILRTLFEPNTKEKLIEYLGFNSDDVAEAEAETAKEDDAQVEGEEDQSNGTTKDKRLSSFFDNGADSESFLADLSSIQATKGAKTNNPFQIYSGSESEADKKITRAVVLGQFEKAVDICLKEDRISDAFMLAVCGGEKCIEKVKTAYFTKAKGPSYLRVLASVVGKNLWDVVYNADLSNWKEVMVALCTFAEEKDFSDLCEELGDRLERAHQQGDSDMRVAASLCYLAGSKLERLINMWIEDFHQAERSAMQETSDDSTFSVHARSLQTFIEKVTVFREAVNYVDQEKNQPSGWKLDPLYAKYCEYADVVSSHGQLDIAGKYLDLLPADYPAATVARNRIKQASKAVPTTATQNRKPQQPAAMTYGTQQPQYRQPQLPQQPATVPSSYAPTNAGMSNSNPYAPPGAATPQAPGPYNPYQPPQQQASAPAGQYGGYQRFNQAQPPYGQPPPRTFSPANPAPPPPKATTNWNDVPEVTKVNRRPTPSAPPPAVSPFPGAVTGVASPPQPGTPFGPPPKATPPPPPKNAAPPQRVASPASYQFRQQSPGITGAGPYAPNVPLPTPSQTPYATGPPPSGTSGRYTPQAPPPGAAPARPGQAIPPPPQGTFAGRAGPAPPGPQYAPPPTTFGQATAPSPYAPMAGQPAPGPYAPPNNGPQSRPGSQQASAPPKAPTPTPAAPPKYPAGDRTHIPSQYRPIYELLSADLERVKSVAPASVQRQVKDTEKRLNILFDHLNNEDLLSTETLEGMMNLAQALADKDYETARGIQVDLVTNKTSECDLWMAGVKRLIDMSRMSE